MTAVYSTFPPAAPDLNCPTQLLKASKATTSCLSFICAGTSSMLDRRSRKTESELGPSLSTLPRREDRTYRPLLNLTLIGSSRGERQDRSWPHTGDNSRWETIDA